MHCIYSMYALKPFAHDCCDNCFCDLPRVGQHVPAMLWPISTTVGSRQCHPQLDHVHCSVECAEICLLAESARSWSWGATNDQHMLLVAVHMWSVYLVESLSGTLWITRWSTILPTSLATWQLLWAMTSSLHLMPPTTWSQSSHHKVNSFTRTIFDITAWSCVHEHLSVPQALPMQFGHQHFCEQCMSASCNIKMVTPQPANTNFPLVNPINPFIQLPGAGQVPCLMNDIENGKLPIINIISIVICQQAECCKCMTQWCIATASSSCLFFCSKWRSIQGVVQRFSAGQPTASYFLLKQLWLHYCSCPGSKGTLKLSCAFVHVFILKCIHCRMSHS